MSGTTLHIVLDEERTAMLDGLCTAAGGGYVAT